MKTKNIKRNKKNRGFVLLFAIVLSSIVLAVTIGVANVLFQETKFNVSAKDANDAFFAADVGVECALYYDRGTTLNNAFTGTAVMNCAGNNITITTVVPSAVWSFTVKGLGKSGQGCSKVTVDKSVSPTTHIVSKGYNNGGATCLQDVNSVERQLELNY